MYKIVGGNLQGLADVEEFIDLINDPPSGVRDFFDKETDIFIARAPGRLDVMGGIADYSGSLVLEMPIAEATFAAVQKIVEPVIEIVSLSDTGMSFTFKMPLSKYATDCQDKDYLPIRKYFSSSPSNHWAAYIAGAFSILSGEVGIQFKSGARILVWSLVPIGKGVSSSAALEVAAMQAICSAFEIRVEPRELALLCQKVENFIVGAACGVMDQITSSCGVENSLVSLLCQPAEIQNMLAIPAAVEFWGIDSGVRHAAAGSDYTSVRVGAFMGYRIIADLAGFEVTEINDGVVRILDRWKGYLANVSPEEYEEVFSSRLPDEITGKDFIDRYAGTTDNVTRIDPARNYAVKAPAEHAIYENNRVELFSNFLQDAETDQQLEALGELMFESHASYSACGLTETGTDRIVELVRAVRDTGVFGARITGGGSGGTVAILARRGNGAAISQIARQYEIETGKKPYIFHGSSPGCSIFGSLRIRCVSDESAMSE